MTHISDVGFRAILSVRCRPPLAPLHGEILFGFHSDTGVSRLWSWGLWSMQASEWIFIQARHKLKRHLLLTLLWKLLDFIFRPTMQTRSSAALLDSEAIMDLQAPQLSSCKTEPINVSKRLLPVVQEDEGNEAGPSEQGWLPFCWTPCPLQPQDPTGFRCFAPRYMYITSFGYTFPCCVLAKPKYFCLVSTQFILTKKDCSQHVKHICNLDPWKAFWDCRPGYMPTSLISASFLQRHSCPSYWVYLWEGKKWSINIKHNKRKRQTNSDRLSSYHFFSGEPA